MRCYDEEDVTPLRTDFPKSIRSHIKMLTDRLAFLRKRIESARGEGKVLSWDEQERGALEWVLAIVERLRWTDAATTPAPEGVPLVLSLHDGNEVAAKRVGGAYRDATGEHEIAAAQVAGWRVLDPLALSSASKTD